MSTGDQPVPISEEPKEETFSEHLDRVVPAGRTENKALAADMADTIEINRVSGELDNEDVMERALPNWVVDKETAMTQLEIEIKDAEEKLAQLKARANDPKRKDFGKPDKADLENYENLQERDKVTESARVQKMNMEYAREHGLSYQGKSQQELSDMVGDHVLSERAKKYGVEIGGKSEEEIEEEINRAASLEAAKAYGMDIEGKSPEEIEAIVRGEGALVGYEFKNIEYAENITGMRFATHLREQGHQSTEQYSEILKEAATLKDEIAKKGVEISLFPFYRTVQGLKRSLEEIERAEKVYGYDVHGMTNKEVCSINNAIYEYHQQREPGYGHRYPDEVRDSRSEGERVDDRRKHYEEAIKIYMASRRKDLDELPRLIEESGLTSVKDSRWHTLDGVSYNDRLRGYMHLSSRAKYKEMVGPELDDALIKDIKSGDLIE